MPSCPDPRTQKDVSFHTAEWHAARIAALQAGVGRCGRPLGRYGVVWEVGRRLLFANC